MLATAVLDAARAQGLMIAAAESCTGGLVSAALTEIAGASVVFERGFVTYTDAAKTELLGVRPATLQAHGAVSRAVAEEMVLGVLAASPADLAISVTGIAGPGGSAHKPEGRVCYARARRGGTMESWQIEHGALGRGTVRLEATRRALRLLLEALEG